jgi:hypothetical protein
LPEVLDDKGHLSEIFTVPIYFELEGIVVFRGLVSRGPTLNLGLFRT